LRRPEVRRLRPLPCDSRPWPSLPHARRHAREQGPGWSWRAGRAARVKLGLPANVAEAVDLRDSAGQLAILTVVSFLTEATSRRASVSLPSMSTEF
jgi:hypothetical protein